MSVTWSFFCFLHSAQYGTYLGVRIETRIETSLVAFECPTKHQVVPVVPKSVFILTFCRKSKLILSGVQCPYMAAQSDTTDLSSKVSPCVPKLLKVR